MTSHKQFQDRIRRVFCEGSAIAPELFEACVEFHTDVEVLSGGDVTYPIHEVLGWDRSKYPHQAHRNMYAAFLKNEDGSIWQVLLADDRDPRGYRYQAPKGNGNRAFLPPIPPSVRRKIADRYGIEIPLTGSFWEFIRDNPRLDIVPTEGGKKGLSLISVGFLGISFYGCDCLKSPDLAPFLPGRQIAIAFDRDTKPKAKFRVQSALRCGALYLQDHGATVAIASWHSKDGKGIDDLIVNCGVEAAERAIAAAKPFTKRASQAELYEYSLERARQQQPLRDADVDLNVRLLANGYWLPDKGDIALCSGLGSGKSELIGEYLKTLPRNIAVVALTHRVALGGNLAERWGLDLINDLDRAKNYWFNSRTNLLSNRWRVAACLDSVHLTPEAPDVLILDEVSKVLRHILTGGTCKKKRPMLLRAFYDRLRAARQVIIADADLTDLEIGFIEAIRGKPMILVRNHYRAPLAIHLLEGEESAAILKALDLVKLGKRVFVACSQKSTASAVAALLQAEGLQPSEVLLIHGDNSGSEESKLFLSDPNVYLERTRIKALVASPTIAEGVSITGDFFDAIVGIFHATSIDDATACQFVRRYRPDVPRYIWAAIGNGHAPRTITELARVDKKIAACTFAKTGFAHGNFPLHWDSAAQQLAYTYHAQREWSLANFRPAIHARLEHQGYTVDVVPVDIASAIDRAQVKENLKLHAQSARHRYRTGVAGAQQICEVEAKAIERKIERGKATEEEHQQLDRYKLEGFYHAEANYDLVKKDRKGQWSRELSRLEDLALPDRAVEIDRNNLEALAILADSPGEVIAADLPKSGARAIATQSLGLADFILHDLMNGYRYDQDDPKIQAIASKSRECAELVRDLFGFSPGRMTDTAIVGALLRAIGLKTNSQQIRKDGRRVRTYELDEATLELAAHILTRREEARAQQGIKACHTPLFKSLLNRVCDRIIPPLIPPRGGAKQIEKPPQIPLAA